MVTNATTMNGGRPLALVTGASSGIGLELARVFARNGFALVMNAEDAALDEAAAQLRASGTDAEAIRADLTEPGEIERLYAEVTRDGRKVDALALNAGVGAGGDFARHTSLDKELRLIDLNVRSTVHLAKLGLRDMVARNEGRVLFTSSIASTMPGSYQAVYNASKSFVQSFALALQDELRDTEVTVTSLMPGPTETEFFERAEMLDTRVGAGDKDDAAEVAQQGFEAMMSGDERVVGGGLGTKAQALASRVLPDSAKAAMHRRMAQPGSAKEDR